jgi:hypothetical protein
MAAKSQSNSVGLHQPSPKETNTIDVNGAMDQHPCKVDITNTKRSHKKKANIPERLRKRKIKSKNVGSVLWAPNQMGSRQSVPSEVNVHLRVKRH